MNELRKILIICLIIVLHGCNLETTTMSFKTYKDKGTIKESLNVFIIHADGHRLFAPINMPNEYKVNNLRVEFEGYIEKDKTLPANVEAIRLESIKKILNLD